MVIKYRDSLKLTSQPQTEHLTVQSRRVTQTQYIEVWQHESMQ